MAFVSTLVSCVDSNGVDQRRGPDEWVTAAVVSSIGETEGPEEHLFGDITSVAIDQRGHVLVADRLGSTVRAFAEDGTFLGWMGREGDGPGEFRRPNDIAIADDGLIYIRDNNRVTVMSYSDGSPFPDSVVLTWNIPGYSNSSSRRAQIVDGQYFYPGYEFRRGEPARYNYLRFGRDGFQHDTVWVPPLPNLARNRSAFYRIDASGGRMVPCLSVAPFAPRASWSMSRRGTLVATDGGSSVLREFDREGVELDAVEVPAPIRGVPSDAERADSLRALRECVDSLPVPLDEVENVASEIRTGEIPNTLPTVLSLHIDSEDRIWVERWPAEGRSHSRFFDVLGPRGQPEFRVRVPSPLRGDPPPFFSRSRGAGIVEDPQTEVQSVMVFRFPGDDP